MNVRAFVCVRESGYKTGGQETVICQNGNKASSTVEGRSRPLRKEEDQAPEEAPEEKVPDPVQAITLA